MIETGLVFLAGIVAGLFAGVLPGVGGVVIMTMAFPFLLQVDPVNILIFYVTMASIDQYFNGITAIVFGVPGASMNIPTQIEGHTLFRQGHGSDAITLSAVGSFIASLFAMLLVVAMLPVLWSVYGIWSSIMQSVLLGQKWLKERLSQYTFMIVASDRREPFGLVYLEAIAANVIILSSKTVGFDTVFPTNPKALRLPANSEYLNRHLLDVRKNTAKIESLYSKTKKRFSKQKIQKLWMDEIYAC